MPKPERPNSYFALRPVVLAMGGNFMRVRNEISDIDKINVLLSEYSTLRAEAIGKGTTQIQVCATAGTVTVAVVGFTMTRSSTIDDFWTFAVLGTLLGLIVLFLSMALYFLWVDVSILSTQISKLEHEINGLSGKRLLRWESENGITSMSTSEKLGRPFGLTQKRASKLRDYTERRDSNNS